MIFKNRCAKVNIKVLVILILVTMAIGTSLFTARHIRRSFLSKADLEAGQAAFEKQDWPTASKKLGAYLSRNPDNIEILKRYAKASLSVRPINVDTLAGTISAYRRIMQLAPDDEISYEKLAMLYTAIGNFEELAHIARTRINQVPDDRKATIWLASALVQLHKTDEAKEVLQSFLTGLDALDDKYPEYAQACAIMSRIILSENPLDAKAKALDVLNQAVNYNPESIEALLNRARFYREIPEISNISPQLARQDLEAADALNTENPLIHLSIGMEWMTHRDLDRAADKLKFIENIPQETLGEYFFDIDDWTASKFLFALQLAIQNKNTSESLSLVDEALTVLKDKGHRAQVLPAIIRFYVATGKVPEARQYLNEYIDIMNIREMSVESKLGLAYVQAQVAKAEGQLHAVIDVLQPAVASNPSRPELWRLLAEAYSLTNQSRRAIDALVQYLRLRPQDPEMTMQLAKEYSKLRDWDRAYETARLAESFDPTEIIVRLIRIEASINIAAEQNSPVNSTKLKALSVELAELQKENPGRVDIRILQSVIAGYLDKPQEAEAELKLAIEECEESLSAEMQLARYYARAKRIAEAISVCQSACERYSEVAEPWLSLSSLHAADEDYDTACGCLKQGLQSVNNQRDKRSLSIRLAMLEILYADRANGINLLKEIASQDEQEIQARLLLLDTREIRDDPAMVEKLITELRKAEGESGLYWRVHQASLWFSNEDWRSRQQDITEAFEYCIDSDPQWSLPVLLLVQMYEKLEDFTRAEEVCRQALVTNPSATDVASKLVSLLERQGRFSEVEQLLQQIEANPRLTSTWNVKSALRTGDYSRAIDELKLRVSNDDRDADSRILLARLVYRQTRDAEEAFKYLEEAEKIVPESMALVAAKVSILKSEDRGKEAREILDDYVMNSNNFIAYSLRGAYLAGEGEMELAEEDYRKLTTFAGQEVAGNELLGNFFVRNKKFNKAIVALEDGLKTYPGDLRLKRGLMKALLLQGQEESLARALDILANLEEQLPQDPELMKLRAMQMLEAATPQSIKDAREKLERVTRLVPRDIDAQLALINIAMRSGEFGAARDYAIRALGSNSNNPDLMLAGSKAELATGNTQNAAKMANLVIQKQPKNTEALGVLLNAAALVGPGDRVMIEGAIKSARLMLEDDPENAEIRAMVVAAALRSKDQILLQEAGTMIEAALAKEPANEMLLLSKARILVSMDKAQAAIPELETYIQTQEGSSSVSAMVTLADLYRLEGDMTKAQERIKQAGLIDPNNQSVIHAKLLLFIAQKRFDEIEEICSAYLSLEDPNPLTLATAASILVSMDSRAVKQEGLKFYERVISLSPSLLSARLGLASTLYQTGDIQGSMETYQKVLEQYPNNIQALNDLAWIIQEHEKNYAVALELANRGLGVASNVKDRLHLLDTRGTILSKMPDRLESAMLDFKTLADMSPNDTRQKAKALLKMGRICIKLDDVEHARQHMQYAWEIDEKINVLTPDERSEITEILKES